MIKAYFQRFTSALLVACATLATYSCSEEELPGYDIPEGYYTDAESIEFNVDEWTLEVGEKFTLEAKVLPEGIYYDNVTWSSSDKDIVKVSEDGVITAVALGEAKIIATSIQTETLTAEVAITVADKVVPVESIEIIQLSNNEVVDAVDVAIKDNVKLGVKFTPEDATNTKVEWVIADYAEFASVDQTGTVRGKREGVCHVEVKSLDNEEIKAQCQITVKYMDLKSFTIFSIETFKPDPENPDAIVPDDVRHDGKRTIGVTQTALLEVDPNPYNATIVSTSWESSDNKIATIDNEGNVTGQGMGTATITATCTDNSGNKVTSTFDVTVDEVIAESISLYSKYTSLRPNESLEADIILNPYPTYAIAGELVWSVEGLDDVTIKENRDLYGGVTATVTAGAQTGAFTLTATYADDPTITASIELTVDSATNININPEFHNAAYPMTDGSVQLTWTYLNTGSGNGDFDAPTITWTSSDETIATVDNNGKVTFGSFANYNYGDVTISAESSYDGTIETVDISIPGGYFRELFNTNKSFGSVNNVNYGAGYYLFSHGVGQAANSSASNFDKGYGYITITSATKTTYASPSKPKFPDESNSNIFYTASRRSDIWCYDETICLINGKTYPYLAVHIDDAIAKGLGNVKYQEFELNVSCSEGTVAAIKGLGSYDGYADSRVSVRYLNDDTMIMIFDFVKIANAHAYTNLEESSTSYLVPTAISMNYNQYGYDVDQTDSEGGISAYAMTEFDFNIYSVQTFATEADIDTYISSLGLQEK